MRIRKFILMLVMLLFAGVASAQTTRVYTLQFNHDGVNTESYEVVVDGTRTAITPVCTGVADARVCTSPLPLTYGVEHSVNVVAVGLFGEASGPIPFVCTPPKVPNNQKVTR